MGNCCSAPIVKDEIKVPVGKGVDSTPDKQGLENAHISASKDQNADIVPPSCLVLKDGLDKSPVKGADGLLQLEITKAADAQETSAMGYPVSYFQTGPPPPPCNEGREETVKLLNLLDAPADSEVSNILNLVTNIFQAPSALVALFGDRRIFIRDTQGCFARGDFPWRWSFCAWTMSSNLHQTMVIENATMDARFRDNHVVKGEPGVRFYVGTPLVASNGHRLGNLCFIDFKPRKFDAASCLILNNFAELVVRQIEKEIALQMKLPENQALQSVYHQMKRTMDCLDNCIMLIDTEAEDGWRVIYANLMFAQLSGIDRDEVVGHSLSAIIKSVNGKDIPASDHIKAAAAGKEFTMSNMEVNGGNGLRLQLKFRPAGAETVDNETLAIGVPNFLPAVGNIQKSRYFFVVVIPEGQNSKSSKSSASSRSVGTADLLSSFYFSQTMEGLELGHMLGQGAYGRVYFGQWLGTPVAVKVMDQCLAQLKDPNGPDLEALLGQEMKHPHIVACLKHSTITNKGCNDTFSDDTALSKSMWDPDSAMPPLIEEDDVDAVIDCCGDAQNGDKKPLWGVIEQDGDEQAIVENSGFTFSDIYSGGSGMKNNGNKGSELSGTRQTILVMEYCDKGTLQDAVDRGWFRTKRSHLEGETNVVAVVATASEIAGALAFLHQRGIMHGDLSPFNVMLTSDGATASMGGRGFVAKVSDFGLARTLDVQSRMVTHTYGTLTHMPPETLEEGVVSKQTDVYSFGVLLWQMLTSTRPWAGMTHGQIITAICKDRRRLQFDPNKPVDPQCATLSMACMALKATERPTMAEVCEMLSRIMSSLE